MSWIGGIAKLLLAQAFLPRPAEPWNAGVDKRTVRNPDCSVRYRVYTPPNARNTIQTCILYAYGNADNIGTVAKHCQEMSDIFECDVVSFDYPGYESGNPPESERQLFLATYYVYLEACSAYTYRVFWGRSIGGAMMVDLATLVECHVLVLDSVFTSAVGTVWLSSYLPLCRVADILCNETKLAAMKGNPQVFVYHSIADTVIPVQHAITMTEELIRLNRPCTVHFVRSLDHNDRWSWKEFDAFYGYIRTHHMA